MWPWMGLWFFWASLPVSTGWLSSEVLNLVVFSTSGQSGIEAHPFRPGLQSSLIVNGYLHCLHSVHFLLAKKTCLRDLISLESGRLKAEERVWALRSGD